MNPRCCMNIVYVSMMMIAPMLFLLTNIDGFQLPTRHSVSRPTAHFLPTSYTVLPAKISKDRRDQLGIDDNEDEYDLSVALENNTNPLISKIIAGSFILVMIGLLIVGVILPITTDYGEGVCNPVLTGGRC